MPPRMLIIVPTRGRPHNAIALHKAWAATTAGCSDLLFVLDGTDPAFTEYDEAFDWCLLTDPACGPVDGVAYHVAPDGLRPGMCGPLNDAARLFAADYFALGFLGDDHRPRTAGWDQLWVDTLAKLGTGFVYGDDLIQHDAFPTAVGLTSNIVTALGWMSPPALDHLCIDLVWRDLGNGLGKLRYLPGTIVEHCHPARGTAPMDAGYESVNNPTMVEHDSLAYYAWVDNELVGNLETLRGLL